jgi:hypothetical protein
VVQGAAVADASSEDRAATTLRASESWSATLALLPRRAVFVAVALVQIAVEMAVTAAREASARGD